MGLVILVTDVLQGKKVPSSKIGLVFGVDIKGGPEAVA